jgi:3-hydroxybutyryl-CoA dehydrogenase
MTPDRGRIAVLGSGVMGSDIALSFALAGIDAVVWGRRAAGVDASRERAARNGAFMVRERLATAADVEAALGRLAYETDVEAALDGGPRLAIEAVSEELELKRDLLGRAEALLDAEALLASTTSALSPTALAAGLARPERFVVMHYAQPAHLMMLVEVVAGERTADETVADAIALLARTGKQAAVCPDIPGFLWSRLQQAVLRELVHLLDRGQVTPEDCDRVLRFGFGSRLPALGPFEHADLVGLDLITDQAAAVWPDLAQQTSPDGTALARLRAAGEKGMAQGRGFYAWTEESADAVRGRRDRELANRLRLLAHDAGPRHDPPRG